MSSMDCPSVGYEIARKPGKPYNVKNVFKKTEKINILLVSLFVKNILRMQ